MPRLIDPSPSKNSQQNTKQNERKKIMNEKTNSQATAKAARNLKTLDGGAARPRIERGASAVITLIDASRRQQFCQ
jgi:hypothetical protein